MKFLTKEEEEDELSIVWVVISVQTEASVYMNQLYGEGLNSRDTLLNK